MCIICDGASWDEARFSLHHMVETYGWAVVPVTTKKREHDWAYTVGLSAGFSHPELVIFGLEANAAGALLNDVGDAIAGGERLQAGELVDGGPGRRFRVGPVHASHFEAGRFAVWVDYYEALGPPLPDAQVLELVLPGRRPRLHRPAPGPQHLPPRMRRRRAR